MASTEPIDERTEGESELFATAEVAVQESGVEIEAEPVDGQVSLHLRTDSVNIRVLMSPERAEELAQAVGPVSVVAGGES